VDLEGFLSSDNGNESSRLLAHIEALELLVTTEQRDGLRARFGFEYSGAESSTAALSRLQKELGDVSFVYIAQSQIQRSLVFSEVVGSMVEVLLNFVGAGSFAFFVLDNSGSLQVLLSEGIEGEIDSPANDSRIVKSLNELFVDDSISSSRNYNTEEPLVCIPVKADHETIGVIVIWSFFKQKKSISNVDKRIFEVFMNVAGVSLEAARLFAESRLATNKGRFESYAKLM